MATMQRPTRSELAEYLDTKKSSTFGRFHVGETSGREAWLDWMEKVLDELAERHPAPTGDTHVHVGTLGVDLLAPGVVAEGTHRAEAGCGHSVASCPSYQQARRRAALPWPVRAVVTALGIRV